MADDRYIVTESDLTSIANAIRTKGGTSASLIFPSGFESAIGDIIIGAECEYGTLTLSSDTYNPTIMFEKQHSTPPFFYAVMWDENSAPEGSYVFCGEVLLNIYDWLGDGFQITSTAKHYGYRITITKAQSYPSPGYGTFTEDPETATVGSANNVRTYTRQDGLYLGIVTSGTKYYPYKANRKYSWIAVWKPTT